MEGSQDYDAVEKGESPRSNNSQDPRDLRRKLGYVYSCIYLTNLHVAKTVLAIKQKVGVFSGHVFTLHLPLFDQNLLPYLFQFYFFSVQF